MKGGRLKLEEKDKRFRILASFIFNFRYATSKEIHTFSQLVMNLSSSKRLVDYSVKDGYLDYYFDTDVRRNIYYLTQKGKDLIDDDETLANHYFFKKTFTGINTFVHHKLVVQTYFLIKSHLDIKEWISEEVIRIGKKRREKIPDALILLPSGVKIALEAESKHKKQAVLKTFVARYRYDIEKISRYDACLVVASGKRHYEGLKGKFLNINTDFFNKRIILTDIVMLEHGMVFYQGESRHLDDVLALLKKG